MSIFSRRTPASTLERELVNARVDAAVLAREMKQEAELVVEWEKKAMLALKAGNDALAKQALGRKFEHLVLALDAERSARRQHVLTATLEARVAELAAVSATTSAAVGSSLRASEAANPGTDEMDLDARAAKLRRVDLDAELRALKKKMGIDREDDREGDDYEPPDEALALVAALVAAGKKDKPN